MKSFVYNSFARKLICVLLLIATVLCLPACTGSSGETVSIVCTAYPQYDFVMQILGEQADRFSVVYLADDGSDMHSFQNRITAADKLTLLRADLLLYTGGTSDAWLSDLLDDPSANPEMVRLSMLSACELLEEDEHEHDGETDGQEEDRAYDEHVWLSLRNAQRMTRAILEELIRNEVGSFIDPMLNERLLSVLSTKENVNLATLGFESTDVKRFAAVVTPIEIAGERLGTLFIYRVTEGYGIDDIILCEYGSTVVGLEMLRSVSEESAEESRKLAVVKSAIGTLSYSETQAIVHIFEELGGMEGVLVASKIADRAGITRSVIVNALRKFESAGIIESRSSGMKGTYIKVKNDVVFDEVKKLSGQIG